jgi:hypothetical protein
MPLFLLPYFYMQFAMTSGASIWTVEVSPNYSPSLPSPEKIANVLR